MELELANIANMQKTLLNNISKSFIDKRNQRTLTRFFTVYRELYT